MERLHHLGSWSKIYSKNLSVLIGSSNRAGKTSDVDDLVQLAEGLGISNKNKPLEPLPQK